MPIFCCLLALLAAGVRERGAGLEAAHRWDEAVRLYRATLDESAAEDPALRFWLLTSLAEVEFNRQDYEAAERWLYRAEQVAAAFRPDSPERLRLLTARGTLHLVRGNLTAAGRDLSRALDLSAGAAPEDRAAVLHNLAAVEMHSGRLEAADGHEREALDLWRVCLSERHESVWRAWISLSSLQGLRGDWTGAEQSLRRALAIRESGEVLSNYAVVLDKLKRGKEARRIRSRLGMAALPLAPPVVDVRDVSPRLRSR